VLLAKLLGLKVVITAHDVQPFVERLSVPWMVERAYGLSDRIIAHNAVSRRELEVVLQIPEDKIIEIPHVNYLPSIGKLPARGEARDRLGIVRDVPVLLFFGQIKEVKGLDHLLQAMPRLLEKYPDAILLIAGKVWKTDFKPYEEQIEALGISQSCVLHIRYIPDSEVADYYAAADLVVLPYKKIYQSGVLIMAMSYSKPVVVSDIEGMTELISDGINGYVFTAGDVEALANKLTDALSAPEESRQTGRRAWLYVQEHHDWRKIGQMTAECYRSALRDGRCDYGR
jgi:glycosyltransferase involved in cell wall biosynthesis